MRQSSLGVIQRVEARYRLAVEVRSGWPRWGKSRSGMAVGVRHCEVEYVGVWSCKAVEVSHVPLACAQVSCERGSRGCVRWVPVSWVAFLQGSPGGASHVKLL